MLIFILEDFFKGENQLSLWSVQNYAKNCMLVVFAVYSDAHIPSCAKASFLQPLLCQPWRIPCSLSAVLITLSANLSVSCYTSLYENLFFWKSAVVFQLPNGMFAVCHIASLTLYSWHLPKPSLKDGISAVTVSVDLDSLRIGLLHMRTLLLSWAHVRHLIPSALPHYPSDLNARLSAISLPFSPKWRMRPCLFFLE